MAKKDLKKKENKPVSAAVENLNPKVQTTESGDYRVVLHSEEHGFGTSDNDLILTTVNRLAYVIRRGKDLQGIL